MASPFKALVVEGTSGVGKSTLIDALIRRHVILNALPPVITITGLQLGYLLGGALLTEVVFAWPGLGSLLYDSITARDLPVIQATTLLIALSFVVANIVVDLINASLDPRLREA